MTATSQQNMISPLLVWLGAITIADINSGLGTISLSVSIAYAIYKFYKEFKNK